MKTLLTTLIFLNSFINCFSQCNYLWVNNSPKSLDTITTSTNWIFDDKSSKVNFDFERLIENIRKYKIEGEFKTGFLNTLDSLKSIKIDSAISEKIDFLEYELSSNFQLIKFDSFEFALYTIDTLILNGGNNCFIQIFIEL